MDLKSNVNKKWKPAKIHKRVKLGKFCKKLNPAKLFKGLKSLSRMLFPTSVPQQGQQPHREDNLAFMTLTIKVNPTGLGWHRAILSVLKDCKGARFKMDQDGVVELSGVSDPNKLLKRLGRTRRIELQWFQFGQCSNNLFMPEAKKNPVQEKPNFYNNPPYNSFIPYRGYGYRYPPPQVFRQCAPYYY